MNKGSFVAEIGKGELDVGGRAWSKVQKTAQENLFFHWDLEFLDIFYDSNGKRRSSSGFDGVIGNPPYGIKLTNTEKFYLKNTFPIGGTNTAAIFTHRSLRLLKKDCMHGFIVPKSLMFSSKEWVKTRNVLTCDMISLVDVGQVWNNVKIEQCIYVVQKGINTSTYTSSMRLKNKIMMITRVDKKTIPLFDVFPSVVSKEEMDLGKKIIKSSYVLSKYITNRRGISLYKYMTDVGVSVIGGKQVQPYHISGTKFYVDPINIDHENAYVTNQSILAQNIVAHIKNPIEHIQITATIPTDTDFVIDETVNQIKMLGSTSPYFILGLLHSNVINWYVYRFIFSRAIRSIKFDPPTTNKIPIRISHENDVIDCVKAIIRHSHNDPNNSYKIQQMTKNLNQLFYSIFELTKNEIQIIEKSFSNPPAN